MEEIITKKELDELKKIEGKVRGIGLKDILEFVLREEHEEGLKKLEDTMVNIGYSLKYKDIKSMDFYPLVLLAVFFLTIKKLFNYDNEKFQEMGRFCSRTSLILRLFMKYLVSVDKVVKETQAMYRKYFTIGNLKIVEYDKEKKYIIARVENLSIHPAHCQYLKGYFSSVIEMATKSSVTCKETECSYRDSEHHEFLLKW